MSFSNPNVKISYDGNGADDRFGINFYYLEGDEDSIIAELWDYTDSDNPLKQTYVKDVDYVIDSSSYPNTEVVTSVPVPVNFKLFIYRSSVLEQSTSFAQGAFPAESVEEMFDRLVMIQQEQAETLTRTITNEIGGSQVTNQDILDAVALEPRVAQNETDILALSTSVGNNTTAINNNATAIGNNAIAIAQNASDISALQSAIGSITPDTYVNVSAGATLNAVNKQTIFIDTIDPVTVTLPAPTLGHTVKVKITSDVNSKTITSGAGIDGFGANYIVSSPYESLTFVANGTQWYIL